MIKIEEIAYTTFQNHFIPGKLILRIVEGSMNAIFRQLENINISFNINS